MLLIRELLRVAGNVVAYSVASRRIWLVVTILLVAVVAAVTTTVTVVGPVVVYPFL